MVMTERTTIGLIDTHAHLDLEDFDEDRETLLDRSQLGIFPSVKGKKIDEVIELLDGIRCGTKGTSCPDQLCRALEQLK